MKDPHRLPTSGVFVAAFALLVVGTLVGAAVVAPGVYASVADPSGSAPWPFSRVYDRVAVVLLIVLLVAGRRQLGLRRVPAAWRAERWGARVRLALLGLAASLVPALVLLAPAIGSSGLVWAGRTLAEAAQKALLAVPAALLVALAEECLYRVVVFRGAAATWDWRWAAAGSALFYSAVHFLVPDREFVPSGASPAAGLSYLGEVLGQVVRLEAMPALFGLFLIGLVLAAALHHTGSLALCTGLHAGWFVAMKVGILVTSLPPSASAGGSAAKRQLLIGSPWVWASVAVTAAVVAAAVVRSRRPAPAG